MVDRIRVADAAALLGVSDDTLRRWADVGRITVHRDGARATVDGVELASLAAEIAADSPLARLVPPDTASSARNGILGIVDSAAGATRHGAGGPGGRPVLPRLADEREARRAARAGRARDPDCQGHDGGHFEGERDPQGVDQRIDQRCRTMAWRVPQTRALGSPSAAVGAVVRRLLLRRRRAPVPIPEIVGCFAEGPDRTVDAAACLDEPLLEPRGTGVQAAEPGTYRDLVFAAAPLAAQIVAALVRRVRGGEARRRSATVTSACCDVRL